MEKVKRLCLDYMPRMNWLARGQLHGANRLASTLLLERLVWGTSIIAESFVQQVVSRAYRPSTGECLGMKKKNIMKLVPNGKPTWTSEALDEKWHEL